MRIQRIAAVFSILLALGLAAPAQAADDRPAASSSGFYGGVSLRDRGQEGLGLTIGNANSVWNRFATPTVDDTSPRTLVFGGYRFSNDVAVEASLNTIDKYALNSADSIGARGVGLSFGSANALADATSRTWNLDVHTSWTFYRAFALYGRLGYAQSDAPREVTAFTSTLPDVRRLGVNYGVGLRYDMNSSLGLRLEYGRFGRFAGEIGTGFLPESDQVTFGVQFRF